MKFSSKSVLLAGLALLPLACTKSASSASSEQSAEKKNAKESLIGVSPFEMSILFPVWDHPELINKLPAIQDIANPAAFPGPALPLEQESFVPLAVRKVMDQALLDDEKLGEEEDFQFSSAGFNPLTEKVFFQKSTSFHVISMRLDPCAPQLIGDACAPQIRLVFQPGSINSDKSFGTADKNIHAVYELKTEEFATIVQEMAALQAATDMNYRFGPLAQHPVINAEGAEGRYFKTVLGIMHRFVRPSRLILIAGLGDSNASQQGHWPMLALAKTAQGFVPTPLVHVVTQPGENPKFVQRTDGVQAGELDNPLPDAANQDRIYMTRAEMDEALGAGRDVWTPAKRQALFQAMQRVNNPLIHNIKTLDCFSCHLVANRLGKISETMAKQNVPMVDAAELYGSTSWNLTQTMDTTEETALQNFSVSLGGQYRVAQRTINETAAVTDQTNSMFFSGKH